MKFFDELLGPPICLIFNLYNTLKKPFVSYRLDSDRVNNILLIKFFGMGSILLSGPMMRALKKRFHKAKIILLTFSGNEQICRRINLIDEVICVETDTFIKFFISIIKALHRIRIRRCEISIDLEFFAKFSTLIQYLCATKARVGFYLIQSGIFLKMMWRGNLLTHQVYYNPHRHTAEVFLALARALGADTDDTTPAAIEIRDEDISHLARLFLETGIEEGQPLIIMNINSSQLCLERRWPIEKFVELAGRILNSSNVKIILIGDSQDMSYTDMFLRMMKDDERLINLTGKLNIGALAALLKKARLIITNDSGPLHIGAYLGTPTVSFFGPEIPERYGPIGQKHTVFYAGVYCSPCLNVYNQKTAPCNGKNECMRKIQVEQVYRIIAERYLK